MPVFLICPTLMIGGSATPAVAGSRGSNSRLLVDRRYTSTMKLSLPSKSTMSAPTFVDLFSSHFRSGFPKDV